MAFSQEQLNAAVFHTLHDVDVVTPDARGAFFTGVTTDGVRGVLALRIGNGWVLNVYARHDFHEDPHTEGGVVLRGQW